MHATAILAQARLHPSCGACGDLMWEWLQGAFFVLVVISIVSLGGLHYRLRADLDRVQEYIEENGAWIAELWNSRARLRHVMHPADPAEP